MGDAGAQQRRDERPDLPGLSRGLAEARDIRAQAVEALDTMSRDAVGAAMMEAFENPANGAAGSAGRLSRRWHATSIAG